MATKTQEKANVPNLRFPGFEGEWEKKRFSEIAGFFKGSGISKDQLSESGNPCILYGELYTKYKNEVIKAVISKTDISTKGLVKSKCNDILIPSSGESAKDIATACCVNLNDILLGGDLNIIRPYKDNGNFISYQLNGRRKFEIAKIAQGSSVVHLYNENLKKLGINLPADINEQNKIASLLVLIDERIETQNKIIEELRSQKNALVERIFNYKNNTEIAKINEPWDLYTYEDLFDVSKKKNIDMSIDNVLSASQVHGMIERNESDIDIKYDKNSITSYKIVDPGDYVVHLRSFQGGFAFSNKKGICSPAYTILKPKGILKYAFLQDFFVSDNFIESLKLVTYGIRDGKSINIEEFLQLPVLIPSLDKQAKIIQVISSLREKINHSIRLGKLFKVQKKWLLKTLFV